MKPRGFWAGLLCLFLCMALVMPAAPAWALSTAQPQVVEIPAAAAHPGFRRHTAAISIPLRVGWYPMEGYMEEPAPGKPDGYLYAYLKELAKQTGFRYEFVFGDAQALKEQLERGEIDLLGMALGNDAKDGRILFSTLTIGTLQSTLFTREQAPLKAHDYAALQGASIGVVRGTQTHAALLTLAQSKGFTPVITEMESPAQLLTAVREGSLDAGAMESYTEQPELRALACFGSRGFYFGISSQQPAVARLLNDAMAELLVADRLLSVKLAEMYLSGTPRQYPLTEDERAYLATKDSLTIAYGDPWEPLLHTLQATPAGIAATLLLDLANELNITLTFEPLSLNTQYDLIAYVPRDEALAAQAGLTLSTPYITLPLALVTKDGSAATVAAADEGLRIPTGITGVPETLVYYPTARDCLDAVLLDQQPAALLNTYQADMFLQQLRYAGLTAQRLGGEGVQVCFAMPQTGDARLLSILNRYIGQLSQAEINDYTILAMLETRPINLSTLVDHMPTDVVLVTLMALLLLAALAILTILISLRGRKAKARTAEIAAFLDYANKINTDVWEVDIRTLERWRYRIVKGDIIRESMSPFSEAVVEKYVHPEDVPAALAMYHSVLAGNNDPQRQMRLDCRLQYDGVYLWNRIIFQPMIPTRIHPASVMVYIMDVDDAVRAEEQKNALLKEALTAAENASRVKSRFTAYISHEIRSPLNAMLGYLAMAKASIHEPERLQDLFVKSEFAANHLLQLIGDVLDMGRIESGGFRLLQEHFSVPELMETLAAIYNAQAKYRGVHYTVQTGELPAPNLLGDSLRVKQVIVNLLSNALKFTPQGGSVTLSATQTLLDGQKARMVFRIADTGIGMTEEFQQQLFSAYTQQDPTIASQFGGSGLGLSISKFLITMMGGSIDVASRVGEGTTFTVTIDFPVDTEKKNHGGEPPSTGECCKDKRLLLVDDNDMNLEIATDLLQRQGGFAIDCATNGKEAVTRFTQSEPGTYDAILMDIRMPVMDGYAAARAIRASDHPDARTVFILAMTADAFEEDIRLAAEAGMDGHVSKPIDFRRLMARLSEAFERPCP